MPFNGAGLFTSLGAPEFPAVSGEFILASYFNSNLNDIFLGLSGVMTRDGQSAPTADLPMASFTFTAMRAANLVGQPIVYGQTNASLKSLTITEGFTVNAPMAITDVLTIPTPLTNINTTQAVNGEWVNDYYAPLLNAALVGVPTAPTAALGTNTTQLATMAALFAQAALLAQINSPTFTGIPSAPTAAPGTNTTQLATTAFVTAAAFSAALPSQAGNAGKFVTTDGTNASWSYPGITSVVTATASTTLTSAPTLLQVTPSSFGVTVVMPDATTCVTGGPFYGVKNAGSYTVRLQDSAGTLLGFVAPGSVAYISLTDNATAAGVWAVDSSTRVGIGAQLVNTTFGIVDSVVAIDATRELILGRGNGPTNGYAVVFDRATNTFGAPALVRSGSLGGAPMVGVLSAVNQVLVVSLSGAAFQAVTLSISGTAITVNTAATATLTSSQLAADCGLLAVGASFVATTLRQIVAMSISGTTVTIGAPSTLPGTTSPVVMSVVSGSVVITSSVTAATAVYITPYSVSGSTLTIGTGATRPNATCVNYKLAPLGNGRFVSIHQAGVYEASIITLSGTTVTLSTVTCAAGGAPADAIIVGTDKVLVSNLSGATTDLRLVTDTAGTASVGGTPLTLTPGYLPVFAQAVGTDVFALTAPASNDAGAARTVSKISCSGTNPVLSDVVTMGVTTAAHGFFSPAARASNTLFQRDPSFIASGAYWRDFKYTSGGNVSQSVALDGLTVGAASALDFAQLQSNSATLTRGARIDADRWVTKGGISITKLECAA